MYHILTSHGYTMDWHGLESNKIIGREVKLLYNMFSVVHYIVCYSLSVIRTSDI